MLRVRNVEKIERERDRERSPKRVGTRGKERKRASTRATR